MIKRIIKKICHKIYLIGKYEDLRVTTIKRNLELHQSAQLESNTDIYSTANIYNNQNNFKKIRIGSGTRIMGDLCIFKHGGEINIGDNCFVGPLSKIWSSVKISIGNNVLVSHNVNIHDNISHPLDSKERHIDYVNFLQNGLNQNLVLSEKEIIIEDDVWIGFNSTILKGVRIGKGAIIGANTVITKDVPAFAVVVGNPPRIVKYTT